MCGDLATQDSARGELVAKGTVSRTGLHIDGGDRVEISCANVS
jgi:hypothetical protein